MKELKLLEQWVNEVAGKYLIENKDKESRPAPTSRTTQDNEKNYFKVPYEINWHEQARRRYPTLDLDDAYDIIHYEHNRDELKVDVRQDSQIKQLQSRIQKIDNTLNKVAKSIGLNTTDLDKSSELGNLIDPEKQTPYQNFATKNQRNQEELNEGGNIFKSPEYTRERPVMLTRRIKRDEVPTVLNYLNELLSGIITTDLSNHTLGSTGIADTSGDIDLAIDANKVNKEKFVQYLIKSGVAANDIRRSGINVHYKSPIGDTGDFVQVDFMFVPDVKFARWTMHPMPRTSKYRGVDWQRLMADVTRTVNPDWKWNQLEGVLNRADNTNVFGRNPNRIAHGLFGRGIGAKNIHSVEQILTILQNHPKRDEILTAYTGDSEATAKADHKKHVNHKDKKNTVATVEPEQDVVDKMVKEWADGL